MRQAAATSLPLVTMWALKKAAWTSCSWKWWGVRTADRTGTSVSILGGNGAVDFDGERRITNLEDVFVLLTGEEIE